MTSTVDQKQEMIPRNKHLRGRIEEFNIEVVGQRQKRRRWSWDGEGCLARSEFQSRPATGKNDEVLNGVGLSGLVASHLFQLLLGNLA